MGRGGLVIDHREATKTFYFLEEPKGDLLWALLNYALHFCSTAQWCIIRESRIGDQLTWIKRVQGHLIHHWKREEIPEYFGTSLNAPPVHGLYLFRYDVAFLEVFKSMGIQGLFSEIPEDFALLRHQDYRN